MSRPTRAPRRPNLAADPLGDLLRRAAERTDDPAVRRWLLALVESPTSAGGDRQDAPRREGVAR